MKTIRNFKKTRRDGNVIDELMSTKDMVSLGWKPDKVVKVEWDNGSQHVALHARFGMLAKVIPGRNFVATIEENDESGKHCMLSVVNADGILHLTFSNAQLIREKEELGEFCWFEKSRIDKPNVFGIVFNCNSDNSMFQLDIDALSGITVGIYPVR